MLGGNGATTENVVKPLLVGENPLDRELIWSWLDQLVTVSHRLSEVYAEHVRHCQRLGYKAYKVHANICWNPRTRSPAPQLPGFPREDLEICRAVREAAGDEMVLMHDPF